jgi:membrane-bound lytic murein transglycosylase A
VAGYRLSRVSFDALPGWHEDSPAKAFNAFRRSAEIARYRRYRTGSLGISHDDLVPAFESALAAGSVSDAEASHFFESYFQPFLVEPAEGAAGFVTGFYEPVAKARRGRTGQFRYPVLAPPPELVEITRDSPRHGIPEGYRFALKSDSGLVPCPDREAIEKGAFERRGLEIAWLADRVDLFFIHVQGAARLEMPDGKICRVTYAAKSGHPFSGPGKILAHLGEFAPDKVTMQSIRTWFGQNSQRIDDILWKNRSYIFFRESEPGDPSLGPVAAAKVQLTPGRSLAVDRLIHTFATPFFINAPKLESMTGKPFSRLMIAQDTGSAIVGPARGDIFTGTGLGAGEKAGVIRHDADFHILVPHSAAERQG